MYRMFGKQKPADKEKPKERLSREELKKLEVKRCPDCLINLPIDARECYSCHAKVGKPDKHGLARRRGTWVSYVTCAVTWAIFLGYLKWAFF